MAKSGFESAIPLPTEMENDLSQKDEQLDLAGQAILSLLQLWYFDYARR